MKLHFGPERLDTEAPPSGATPKTPATLARHEQPSRARLVELPRITDPRGNLTAIEAGQHIPFECRRVYYLYDVPGGTNRGGHAHKQLQQLLIAASGSFDVVVDDGTTRERIFLNRSYYGLYIPAMCWRDLENFSSGSVCLVLASEHYDASDYYRDYDEFLAATFAHNASTSTFTSGSTSTQPVPHLGSRAIDRLPTRAGSDPEP